MTEKREIEFTVDILNRTPGMLLVGGRCSRDLIKVGDIFEFVYRFAPVNTYQDYANPGVRIWERRVSLRVESMRAYGHWFEEIDPGLTAEVKLSGSGGEFLEEGTVLGGASHM